MVENELREIFGLPDGIRAWHARIALPARPTRAQARAGGQAAAEMALGGLIAALQGFRRGDAAAAWACRILREPNGRPILAAATGRSLPAGLDVKNVDLSITHSRMSAQALLVWRQPGCGEEGFHAGL